jgi:hypothetical protein
VSAVGVRLDRLDLLLGARVGDQFGALAAEGAQDDGLRVEALGEPARVAPDPLDQVAGAGAGEAGHRASVPPLAGCDLRVVRVERRVDGRTAGIQRVVMSFSSFRWAPKPGGLGSGRGLPGSG